MSTVTTTMSRLLLAHIVSSTEERDPMCEFGDYNYVPTSARSCNRRGPVTSVDGSSRSVVWFPVHGTALMLAVLRFLQLAGLETLALHNPAVCRGSWVRLNPSYQVPLPVLPSAGTGDTSSSKYLFFQGWKRRPTGHWSSVAALGTRFLL